MKIGAVVAMTSERRHLLDLAGKVDQQPQDPWPNHLLSMHGHDVLVVTSGIGLINAAGATEWLLHHFKPDMVLNFGCAGSHRRDLMPGDVVIVTEAINSHALQVLPDGSERFAGFINEEDGDHSLGPDIKTDPRLVSLAQSAAAATPPEPWPQHLYWPASIPYRQPVVVSGPVASADIWTQSPRRLDVLHERHGSLCEEMEAVAVARVCQIHSIPFLAVKDISNNEYHRSSDIETFGDFPVAEVGKRAARIVAGVIALLPERLSMISIRDTEAA